VDKDWAYEPYPGGGFSFPSLCGIQDDKLRKEFVEFIRNNVYVFPGMFERCRIGVSQATLDEKGYCKGIFRLLDSG